MIQGLLDFLTMTGFAGITWQMAVMWAVAGTLLYLAVAKGFEPLLLVPIAFGALLANLPTRGVITAETLPNGVYQTGTFKMEGTLQDNAGEAAQLDLMIRAPQIDHRAIIAQFRHIAGGIEALPRMTGIGDEALGRQIGPPEIAARQLETAEV